MVGIFFLVVLVLVSQGHSQTTVTEVQLADSFVSHTPNPLLGTSFGIQKDLFDILEVCYITFPNGVQYEAYPNDSLPEGEIFFSYAATPFVACSFGIRGGDSSYEGTYQLQALVAHATDLTTQTLSKQNFYLTVNEL